jgi:hypothetical protein
MEDVENNTPGAYSDILSSFPSEIWIQIIKDALPVRGYSSALLLLTTVSKQWMRALMLVPTLWAYIDLRGSQEDSMATIEVFKQLSSDIPLKISIYVPTRHDITLIGSILASVAPRLREVAIRHDMEHSSAFIEPYSVLSFLLMNRHYLPRVIRIDVEGSSEYSLYAVATTRLMNVALLPPLLCVSIGLRFEWSDFKQDHLQNLKEIEAECPLEHVITDLVQLPQLTSIKIYGYSPRLGRSLAGGKASTRRK